MTVAISKRGFVLVEIILVFLIAAIVAGIFLIAMPPGQDLAQINNTGRSAAVQSILSAVGKYQADHKGALPRGIPTKSPQIIGSRAGQSNICAALVPKYSEDLPVDPTAKNAHFKNCADYYTEYAILNSGGHLTVSAPSAEMGDLISATR